MLQVKVNPENAKRRASDIVCTLFEISPETSPGEAILINFLLTPEVIISLGKDMPWFKALISLLEIRVKRNSDDWISVSPENLDCEAIKHLNSLFPDVVEIADLHP